MLEKNIEKKIIDTINNSGGFIKKLAPKANTGNKGYPDLTGVINGRYISIEVKNIEKERPTPVQLKNLQKIANAGGIAIITNDVTIVDLLFKQSHYKQLKSTSENLIFYTKNISEDISVKETYQIWNQKKGIRTLQILKS